MTTFFVILTIGLVIVGIVVFFIARSRSTVMETWKVEYGNADNFVVNGDSFSFNFPSQGSVNYITKSYRGTGKTIMASFNIEGAAELAAVEGGEPQVRLYIQRKGDDMSGLGDYEFYRWWSNPLSAALLPAGPHTLIQDIDPRAWSSVMGKSGEYAPQAFADAWNNIGYVGITFGGNYFGHGVRLTSGKARFTMVDYKIL